MSRSGGANIHPSLHATGASSNLNSTSMIWKTEHYGRSFSSHLSNAPMLPFFIHIERVLSHEAVSMCIAQGLPGPLMKLWRMMMMMLVLVHYSHRAN